ncbi:MAG: HAMP domain-containing histidine kinase [Ruminococcus sp.]|nr:HAMP domain-containing histidine kinase [Ruminococcus sp.]
MFKGITRRWIFSTMLLTVLIIILIVTGLIYGTVYLFNNEVERTLTTVGQELSTVFENYEADNSTAFTSGARNYVENFQHKEQMEVMVVNSTGRIVLTSTGFSYDEDEDIQDFEKAKNSKDGYAFESGTSLSGEQITSYTRIITNRNGYAVGAIRYVVSTTDVTNRIIIISSIIIFAGLVILFIIILSGSYFIRSILMPVRELSETAHKIAHGDFSTKIEKRYNDEIGDLFDAITDMAKDLEATEQMKNDFISRVSHELRTPLTAIKGWAETMQLSGRKKLDRRTFDKGMDVIIKESGRLTGIVEELLDFSRIQTGRMVLINEKLDILAEIDEVIYMLKDRAVNEGKHLIYDEPVEIFPPVYGDRNRLKQVFINVIDNALKYTPEDGVVAIEIKYDKKADPDNIIITITDTGCGISAEDLPKVKEKFYKANQKVNGSGIGLAVADEIIQLHKGKLDIESGVGIGTTVTVTLPVLNES